MNQHTVSDHIRLIARIVARLNAYRKHGRISEAQWARLVKAAIGEFRP